ncbi:MAG TPA: hypothetical protein ENJ56_06475, partial [Anaerolineae bacterium]|nr:hypothetical protein [Anaerolineae bacterium]
MNQQHNISHKQRRPLPPTIRLLLSGLCLGVVFFFNLTQSAAATPPAACGASEAGCQLQANFSAVSSSNTLPGITAVNSSAFGSLIYPDFIEIEQLARAALRRGLIMRESISPYRDDNDFDTFTNHLDTEAGFSTVYTPTTPYDSGLTLNAIVDNVEADLTEARDLYAYLLVFAPNYRFRADAAYISTVPSGYPKALCDPALPENPNPPDPNFTGQVLPPVVDWCDFQSRLRQSVREAANMRLIFGQEFMVDALGVNFSGGFIGG